MKLLFRMTPQGSFYSGNQFLYTYDFPFIRSDSLFRAIVKSWEVLWGADNTQKLLDRFWNAQQESELPFYVSSVFPLIGSSYFLPRPVGFDLSHDSERAARTGKDQISWISAELYREWLQCNKVMWNADNFLSPSLYFHPKEAVALKSAVKDKIAWCEDEGRTRNVVDRLSATCKVYPANQIFYADKLECYLLCAMQASYQPKLEAVFRFLADEGIGGKRGIGCGSYLYHPPTPLPDALDFVASPLAGRWLTLSLYYPGVEHMQQDVLGKSRLELIERQGWSSDDSGRADRQQRVRLVREGSSLPCADLPLPSLIQAGGSKASYHFVYPFRIAAPAQ